jgi:hypothetical protein
MVAEDMIIHSTSEEAESVKMTPETLRDVVEGIHGMRDWYTTESADTVNAAAAHILAAAAAWEAERAFVAEDVGSLHSQLVEASEELFALRQRLDAAERALRAANIDNDMACLNGSGAWTYRSDTQRLIDAALAGEET